MDFAQDFFEALDPIPATYKRGVDEFDLEIAVQESDKAFRTTKRDALIGSDASGVVLDDARFRRGGLITTSLGQTFRVDDYHLSSIPGLTDLKLDRIEGDATPVFDATDMVSLDAEIELDGVTVEAHINRSVEVEEINSAGTRVVVSRMMIAVTAEDGASAKGGSVVRVCGRRKNVVRVMDDGLGFKKLLV